MKVKTGAVIVAAGMSSRRGDFKPLLRIGAISMVQRIIANFQQAGVSPIVLLPDSEVLNLKNIFQKWT